MEVYSVIMERWGDNEEHSYLIGLYSKIEDAVIEGLSHQIWRDNKYIPKIHRCVIDSTDLVKIDLKIAIDYAIMKYPQKFNDKKELIEEE